MNKELCHDGIKGMKWGKRNYRNYDGTLTPEGKIRYGRNGKKASTYNSRMRDYRKKVDPIKVHLMTDKDLDQKIERLKKEKTYKELERDNLKEGDRFVHDVLSKSGKIIATGTLVYVGKVAVESFLGPGAGKFIKVDKK